LDGISKTVATRIFANSCLGKVRKQRARCRQSRVEAASVFHWFGHGHGVTLRVVADYELVLSLSFVLFVVVDLFTWRRTTACKPKNHDAPCYVNKFTWELNAGGAYCMRLLYVSMARAKPKFYDDVLWWTHPGA
jgi:hypothetical protein